MITAVLLRSGRLPTNNSEDDAPTDGDDIDDSVDVAALQRRVAELESENRYLQEILHIRTVAAPTPS